MPLPAGTRLGVYELITLIGQGGMGVVAGATFSWGQPRPVIRGSFERPTSDQQFDVWNDRFLVLKAAESRGSVPTIVIVQNWFEELKQRAPAR